MTRQAFPFEDYLNSVVRFLDTMEYYDTNYTAEERVSKLHYVYTNTAKHLAHYDRQKQIKMSPNNLQALIQVTVAMVVYGWATVSENVMVDLSIHFTYVLILDNSTDDNPAKSLESFHNTMLAGLPQEHPWWQMVNNHFPLVLRHYGPYCGLTLIRSTADCSYSSSFPTTHVTDIVACKVFQRCLVEQHNFMGFPGSLNYPIVLRRMNPLGQCIGSSIFPKERFDENELFSEITAGIAEMENWMVSVTGLLSFYKEFDEPRDQANLVDNYAWSNKITPEGPLENLTTDTIVDSEQLLAAFRDKDPRISQTLSTFCQGYVTWHLCDPRYRLEELHSFGGESTEVSAKFHNYLQSAKEAGSVDPEAWAYPSVASLAADDLAYWSDGL
ncbi:hypothetical protein PDIDSM_02860 [Penicillium digitatum]|nr:hypothetical protein PDIDSM_02860 [Penicillium digitatum]